MTDILPYLERVRARFAEPTLQETFKHFNKTLLFELSDTRQFFLLTIVNGQATLEEKYLEKPDARVTSTTDVLAGIMDKKINPMTAYMTRKVKVQGTQADLMQLQKLLF
jgi:putative sterol carrier protein